MGFATAVIMHDYCLSLSRVKVFSSLELLFLRAMLGPPARIPHTVSALPSKDCFNMATPTTTPTDSPNVSTGPIARTVSGSTSTSGNNPVSSVSTTSQTPAHPTSTPTAAVESPPPSNPTTQAVQPPAFVEVASCLQPYRRDLDGSSHRLGYIRRISVFRDSL